MSRSARQITRVIAEFGEKQFNEMNPDLVEVLKVKDAMIRKYWARLKGIKYLVAVVSSDRVRIYFFNSQAVMLVGENVEHTIYEKIRKKSRLIVKYEQPKPPTELELRMEATEELRSALAKSLRRVSRFLGRKEPEYPLIFVSKELELDFLQSYGLSIEDDGSYIFLESMMTPSTIEPLTLRAAFLAQLETTQAQSEIAQIFSNALTRMLLRDKSKERWTDWWQKQSKGTEYDGIVKHLIAHDKSYGASGMTRILDLLMHSSSLDNLSDWKDALSVLHTYHEVNLGTEAESVISGFCKNITKPNKIFQNRFRFEEIHLNPRVLCNPVPLGIHLGLEVRDTKKEEETHWLAVRFQEGQKELSLILHDGCDMPLSRIRYYLRIADIFPKSGGLQSMGKDILNWAMEKLNGSKKSTYLVESEIQLTDVPITESERAVLERLCLGDETILANSLLGSPERVESLTHSGCISIVPSFAHIGVEPNYLVQGPSEVVIESIIPLVLEATVFETPKSCRAVVSAPSIWGKELLKKSAELDLGIWPLTSIDSPRNIIRQEKDQLSQ